MSSPAENLDPLDPVPIIEDDQQLYDWGIEHRLDQYYGDQGNPQGHPQGHPQPPPAHFQYPQTPTQPPKVGYILPDHLQQQENAYLVTIAEDQDQKPKNTVLPVSPVPQSHLAVKTEIDAKRSPYSKPLNLKPNGVPGRRPILPTVDMDANELLKVNLNLALYISYFPNINFWV